MSPANSAKTSPNAATVLPTSAAYVALPDGAVNATRRSVSISGLALDYYQVQP